MDLMKTCNFRALETIFDKNRINDLKSIFVKLRGETRRKRYDIINETRSEEALWEIIL